MRCRSWANCASSAGSTSGRSDTGEPGMPYLPAPEASGFVSICNDPTGLWIRALFVILDERALM